MQNNQIAETSDDGKSMSNRDTAAGGVEQSSLQQLEQQAALIERKVASHRAFALNYFQLVTEKGNSLEAQFQQVSERIAMLRSTSRIDADDGADIICAGKEASTFDESNPCKKNQCKHAVLDDNAARSIHLRTANEESKKQSNVTDTDKTQVGKKRPLH